MNYQDRTRIILELLVADGLRGFTPPRGISDEDQEGIILRIAEALNRKLPVVDEARFRSLLASTFANVHDTHDGYAWPTQAEFVKGLPVYGIVGTKAPETFKADDGQHITRAMNDGWALPERKVWSPLVDTLVAERAVSSDRVHAYRRASVQGYVDTYGSQANAMMAARLGPIVNRYFQGAAA